MPVAVVQVRVVRMAVAQRPVHVRMRVRLHRGDARVVRVLVVLVVVMLVLVLERLVVVLVLVALRDMEPHTGQHERATGGELYGEWLAERRHGGDSAGERCDGKVGSGACCAEIA
jgi:hypothetical protein